MLAEGYEVENPVTNARGRIKLQEHATDNEKHLMGQMQLLQDMMQAMQDQLRRLDINRPRPPDLQASGTITSGGTLGIGDLASDTPRER